MKVQPQSLGVCVWWDPAYAFTKVQRNSPGMRALDAQEGVCRIQNLRVNVCGKDGGEKTEQHWQD